MSNRDGEPMFAHLSGRRALLPGQLLVPALLIVCAMFIVGMAIAGWVFAGTPLPLSVLWSPLFAVSAWANVQAREEWPGSTQHTFPRVAIVGLTLSILGLAYGVWEWRWHGGDPWFAAYALGLLIVGPLGWRRRMHPKQPTFRSDL